MAAVTKTQLSELQKRLSAGISKFRLPLLIFAAGLLLMLLPTGKRSTQAVQTAAQAVQTQELTPSQEEMEAILSRIDGVGRVDLLLTLRTSGASVYQTDTRTVTSGSGTTEECQTVFGQTSGSGKEPVVQTTLAPQYQGALVVCDGADRASVRLAVVQAVTSLTGLESNQIAVVKMKGQ